MYKNTCRRLICALLCFGLLCSCSVAPEEQSVPIAQKTKRSKEPGPPPIECQWIETTAEIPPGDSELNGRLWDGPMPEGVDLRNRLYTDGLGTMTVIDLDGNLVRWGWNQDDMDAGWNNEDGRQPYSQRNVLMKNVQKMAPGYRASLVVDDNQDLWGWGLNFNLLMYDGDLSHPPKEPVKILSGVKDAAAGVFHTAVVRTDGRLQIWGCMDINGEMEGYEKPVTLQTGIEKVCSVDPLMYIDQQHHLYRYYRDKWSNQQKLTLVDSDIDDISFLSWNFFLERKTDGSVWIKKLHREPVLLAEDSIQLAYNGYITPDGTFWGCRESDRGYTLIIQPMDSACSILGYSSRGDVHIMKDGEIRVCLNEEETESSSE